jgi:hypothetical protein
MAPNDGRQAERRARWAALSGEEQRRLLQEHAAKQPAGEIPDDILLYVIFLDVDTEEERAYEEQHGRERLEPEPEE